MSDVETIVQQQATARTERLALAERWRDYFSLQLRLAEVVAATTASPLADAVLQYTNFVRRFGLDHLQEEVTQAPEWAIYAARLNLLQLHEERVQWTQAFFRQAAPERLPPGRRHFGCFGVDPANAAGVVRIHFVNYDNDAIGPLSKAKIARRTQELHTMFSHIKKTYPHASGVQGGSWLYNLEAYRRLFPPEYGASRTVLEDSSNFRGTSRWGQFLDHTGRVKPELRDTFLANLARINMDRLWEVFPLPTLKAYAPIEAFYEYYGIVEGA